MVRGHFFSNGRRCPVGHFWSFATLVCPRTPSQLERIPRPPVHLSVPAPACPLGNWCLLSHRIPVECLLLYYAELPIVWEFSKTLGCLGLLPPLFAGIDQSDRARIEIRREARYSEGTFRVVFVALLVAQACLAHKMKFLRLSGGLP